MKTPTIFGQTPLWTAWVAAAIDVQHLFAGGESLRGNTWGLGPMGDLVRPSNRAVRRSPASEDAGAKGLPALVDQLLDRMASFDDIESMLIDRAIPRCDGDVSAVARRLNLRRGQVEFRIKKRSPDA